MIACLATCGTRDKVPVYAMEVTEVPAERFWKSRLEIYTVFFFMKISVNLPKLKNERLVFLSFMLKMMINTTNLETFVNRTFFHLSSKSRRLSTREIL